MSLSLPILTPGPTVKAQMTAASSVATAALLQGMVIDVLSDADCWVAFGTAATNPASGAASYPIIAKQHTTLRVPTRTNAVYPGQGAPVAADQLNAITGATGNIWVTQLINQ